MEIKNKDTIEKIENFNDIYGIDFTYLEMHDIDDIIRDLQELEMDAASLIRDLEEKLGEKRRMKRKARIYTFEKFKELLGIEGDIFLVQLRSDGILIETYNEGEEHVEGVVSPPDRIFTRSEKKVRFPVEEKRE